MRICDALCCAARCLVYLLLVFAPVLCSKSMAQRPANAPPTLVAHFPFDETRPGPVTDATGGQAILRRGQAVNREGPMNRAFQFAKRTDRIDTGNKALLPANGDFTILMWIATRQSGEGHLLSNDGGQTNHACLNVSGGKLGWSHHGGVGDRSAGFRVSDGRWHLVGVTRKGQEFTLWIDGRQYPSGKSSAPISQAHGWSIGSNATGTTGAFEGLIDDVRVYHGALDDKAIQRLLDKGKHDAPGIPATKKPNTLTPPSRPGTEIPPAFDPRAVPE